MINNVVKTLIESKEFISVATCGSDNRPNGAPKFLLKVDSSYIYLVDYIIGQTFRNLKANPRVSLSFFDIHTLVGYQINGRVEIIESGQEYDLALQDLERKEINLSATRIIDGIVQGKTHKAYEITVSEQFVILKVKVEEVVQIHPSGTLKRERI
ncbi:MAG: pyridoxamine 5'-phosphate oxidase family protein [Candidatus Omnitrophota bacterium]